MFSPYTTSKSLSTAWAATLIVIGLLFTSGSLGFGVEQAMKDKAQQNQQQEDMDPAKAMTVEQAVKTYIGNQQAIERGKGLYGNTCLFCHGPKGKGARAPTLVTNGFAPGGVIDNETFFSTIKYGRPGTIMGAFEGTISETEMWQVMAYLREEANSIAKE